LTHLQPSGFLLDAWCSHWQELQVETLHLGAFLQERNWLFAIRAVVVDQSNLLAFDVATFFFGDVLHDDVSARPVSALQWEVPLEHLTIAGL